MNEHELTNCCNLLLLGCWEYEPRVSCWLRALPWSKPQGQIRKRRSAAGVRMPLSQGLEATAGDWSQKFSRDWLRPLYNSHQPTWFSIIHHSWCLGPWCVIYFRAWCRLKLKSSDSEVRWAMPAWHHWNSFREGETPSHPLYSYTARGNSSHWEQRSLMSNMLKACLTLFISFSKIQYTMNGFCSTCTVLPSFWV
jgi:hypothetical protein